MSIALLGLPAYYVITLYPHTYATMLLRNADPKLYDNANPNNSARTERARKALGPVRFAQWERARAAHYNGLHGFPLFAAAVLAGTVTHEPLLVSAAALVVALRAVYSVAYIYTTSRSKSLGRSLIWMTEHAVSFALLVRAALRG